MEWPAFKKSFYFLFHCMNFNFITPDVRSFLFFCTSFFFVVRLFFGLDYSLSRVQTKRWKNRPEVSVNKSHWSVYINWSYQRGNHCGTHHNVQKGWAVGTSGFESLSESRCLMSLAIEKNTCSTFRFVFALCNSVKDLIILEKEEEKHI